MIAAKLVYFLIKNHAFIDGNKRIGILVMITFLELNGIELKVNDEDLIELGYGIAENSITEKEILDWILAHT